MPYDRSGMPRRRRAHRTAFVLFATTFATAACNALNGGHDRFLDEGDSASSRPRGEAGAPDVVVVNDGATMIHDGGDGGDGGTSIEVQPPFKSLNGATFTSDGSGTYVTAYDGGGANHAVLVPVQQPAIPAEDYTVHAVVRAPKNGEFGILTRIQPDGSGYGLGSSGFGQGNKPFVGVFAPPEWAPSNDNQAKNAYVYVPNGRYHMQLKAVGSTISGKLWEMAEPEPAAYQVVGIAPWSTGRGVGFYDYLLAGAVLESLRVTVP